MQHGSSHALRRPNKQGNVISPTTPEAAAQFLRDEMNRYAVLVKKGDVKVD
jgi:hypothetical protein